MSRAISRPANKTWCWRRGIDPGSEDTWADRLRAAGCSTAVFIERPGRKRVLVEVYDASRAPVAALMRLFGGSVRAVAAKEWLAPRASAPTRIGRRLEIVHDREAKSKAQAPARLRIPHGIAFGSGEHATTSMLLRALAGRSDWQGAAVLDLGTGSGVLALAARLFGAQKIVATDFDADAVRTARENEELNFSTPRVRWRRADVKRLRPTTRYNLVLANLFSGILVEAAPQIAACVKDGGELWLSGILKSQEDAVVAAYRRRGMRLVRAARRGKWVMLQLAPTKAKRSSPR